MLLKKSFAKDTVNGVQIGGGTVAFQNVKLNVYSFYTDGILIDTGANSLQHLFRPFFNKLDIKKVLITHYHEDHTGCAAYLQNDYQLPVYMDRMMIPYCETKADYPLYRKLFWGKRKPFRAEPANETFHSDNAVWRAVKTPGHAADHLAYLNQETGQLFTGDLYCQTKTKVVLKEESMPVMISSLEKILTYDFDEVFCSHAGWLGNGRDALKEKLDYLQDLQGNILNLYEKGMKADQIKSELFPKKYPITLFSFGEWDSIHIVNSIIGNRNG
ncbi:MBL fold metallo-hydrolase [Salipaludibacillus aurantiacus]|uniref:Glyoxylase, beta-lactamase superfamily II n=1 Tax=Salipaludibacillus aurantiacus TaxID=1601833 RepID=A0A1H9W2L0_9BACI|nr:MBL fold metallo-hydrolase [Salipaludibacillus aurantiacus]SES27907.1 Glyoxylase, beta-lactamase superfamily II [Salipaludibacillus aurantiacus]